MKVKVSEKFAILREIADALENCAGTFKENVYDYAEWYCYRFDREKFDDYKSSDENLQYHNQICDEYEHYKMREEYRQIVINELISNISHLI